MTDAGREATTSVPPSPCAPLGVQSAECRVQSGDRPNSALCTLHSARPLPPRWVRKIVIGGAVAGAMALALPGLVWALAKRKGGKKGSEGVADTGGQQASKPEIEALGEMPDREDGQGRGDQESAPRKRRRHENSPSENE